MQENAPSVQEAVERGLAIVLRQSVRIQGAGRTDAGVHALGQVASFEAETDIHPDRLRRGVTALVRPEISIVDAAVAPAGFNARFDSIGKHYRYQIVSRRTHSPLRRHTSYFVPQRLQVERMREAAAALLGDHDFAGFRASDCGRPRTDCTLREVKITGDDRGYLEIDVKGIAFLKNMVRIIVGTLLEVGKGRFSPDIIGKLFESGDRRMAGPTVPAHGLTLVEVFYPEGWIRSRT